MEQTTLPRSHSSKDIIDHLLLVFLILTAVSGQILDAVVERHPLSGHSFWLAAHIVIASGFTVLSLIHFKHHWGWFRTLPHNLKARRKDSLFLFLALMILLVSGIFVAVCKTHISGFTHALTGYLCLIVGIYHFYVRHIRPKKKSRK